MEYWIVDSDNLGPLQLPSVPDDVTVIAASNNRRLLPLIAGQVVDELVPVWPEASDFKLIADVAVALAMPDGTEDVSKLRVYTRDIGLACGVKRLAKQYKLKFQWEKTY